MPVSQHLKLKSMDSFVCNKGHQYAHMPEETIALRIQTFDRTGPLNIGDLVNESTLAQQTCMCDSKPRVARRVVQEAGKVLALDVHRIVDDYGAAKNSCRVNFGETFDLVTATMAENGNARACFLTTVPPALTRNCTHTARDGRPDLGVRPSRGRRPRG
eukprot:Unigene2669_Nuclearia_a/m.8254 Unigene2669_Nuclearia_a/g.8254  ORF Unigene2669_Nuclearia_a/g.8254 Unigene2669_Nuclearia_a/m.8254 type:complete len:159 (+) Unigene2669_Nuclearia_a:540-1016(+)